MNLALLAGRGRGRAVVAAIPGPRSGSVLVPPPLELLVHVLQQLGETLDDRRSVHERRRAVDLGVERLHLVRVHVLLRLDLVRAHRHRRVNLAEQRLKRLPNVLEGLLLDVALYVRFDAALVYVVDRGCVILQVHVHFLQLQRKILFLALVRN